ncbi:FapA family protein [Pseudocolwellia sp. AS88]|uniref:DUF342 domain-containing protein n=1 Tax=Pseudocolwellia sp. AS88 TaxID=3063958 RepID=UPI0026F09FEC|nr:FapA family protein [Pseudocolwellia sp. AS88]MDO7086357.1 FapA family protein [Pseudocolwellia sp. AS88]
MTQANLVENKKNNIDLVLQPIKNDSVINESVIQSLIEKSEYSHLELNISNIRNAIAELNSVLKPLQKDKTGREIRYQVLERKDATIEIKIDDDEMSASAEITTALGGKNLTAKDILNSAQAAGVKKGFVKEGLIRLAQKSITEPEGILLKEVIAKGKTPINGSNARIKLLVQCAQDRILRPRERDDGTVDMRDLGDIICVRVGEPLAQIIPCTEGVKGYTVKGAPLEPNPGDDIEMTAGEGTIISPKNKNILISTLVGLPRSINNGIAIDEVYKLKNVDVTTGHIKFEGSVIIDGDVCEGMKVVAKGDITVGGFVESAYLEAGGDITIIGGILGKKQEVEDLSKSDITMSATINAVGNIFAKYCQYADITCNTLRINNQLMHSIIDVNDKVWVGSEEKADGKLIAGYINAVNSVHAGTVGATAGSATTITFNKKIQEYRQQIIEVEEQLKIETNKTQELKVATNKIKALPKGKAPAEMIKKVVSTYQYHARKMGEILVEKEIIEAQIQTYMTEVYIEATERIYHGVKLNIGDFNERTKREHGPSKMFYLERKVHIDPIIHT